MNQNVVNQLPVLKQIIPNHTFKKGDVVFIVSLYPRGGSIINKFLKKYIGMTAKIISVSKTPYKIKPYTLLIDGETLFADESEISLIKGGA